MAIALTKIGSPIPTCPYTQPKLLATSPSAANVVAKPVANQTDCSTALPAIFQLIAPHVAHCNRQHREHTGRQASQQPS